MTSLWVWSIFLFTFVILKKVRCKSPENYCKFAKPILIGSMLKKTSPLVLPFGSSSKKFVNGCGIVIVSVTGKKGKDGAISA